ncbi:unnamed protein product [Rotaria socialis]|uniref:Uncharacterized protein n=1 Tax=Rotaria socialis TaxID=392032 RepID=A0A817UEK1_9BILA|nr:unnamed protein product [Rotaria socialis]CAF3329669.1 unnamed protein product [Rotaria socialis]CAF3412503.1 unnamed protein product [Rotaria socialis]CAF3470381.1 unnamed protein product [Rotaria socialis]CAF3740764.1 unnamed protein product [Rotaria socialis]
MSIAIEKISLYLTIVLLCALFIGAHATNDADHSISSNGNQKLSYAFHVMAKRRFLPTRSESYQYINDDVNDSNDEDRSHLNAKRYFLKSKRYFLNSKRFAKNEYE